MGTPTSTTVVPPFTSVRTRPTNESSTPAPTARLAGWSARACGICAWISATVDGLPSRKPSGRTRKPPGALMLPVASGCTTDPRTRFTRPRQRHSMETSDALQLTTLSWPVSREQSVNSWPIGLGANASWNVLSVSMEL